jgi:glycerol kinase
LGLFLHTSTLILLFNSDYHYAVGGHLFFALDGLGAVLQALRSDSATFITATPVILQAAKIQAEYQAGCFIPAFSD